MIAAPRRAVPSAGPATYGLVGKFSSVVGPLIYGSIVGALLATLGTAAYQVAIGSLLVLLFVGIAILRGVPEGSAE